MSLPSRVVLATRSAGKVRELTPLLAEFGVIAIGLDEAGCAWRAEEDDIEVGASFEENAQLKATYYARRLGAPVLAEDSGLCVDALDGAPGVQSKRWSGEPPAGVSREQHNNASLLEALRSVEDRAAAFVCVAVWCDGDRVWSAEGRTPGRVLRVAEGTGGFGYDPLFYSEELGATFASVDASRKSSVSHRGRAVRALLKKVQMGS